MLDALMYAVRDAVRGANIGYGEAECEIMDGGEPPPRCGNFFVSVHGGKDRSDRDNQLMEYTDFSVTLTARITVPLDRVGDQLIHRNLASVPLGQRQGFRRKVDQLRALLHMNWKMVVLQGQMPASANDNLAAWTTGTVYGFVEPARYRGAEVAKLVGPEWFGGTPNSAEQGLASELRFEGARRMQPQTAAAGPFV